MELIPVKEAVIIWQDGSPKHKITEVFACHEDSEPNWGNNSRGSCNAEWMDGVTWWATPMGLFLEMATTGFVDENVKVETLKQFTKIEGQDWAHALLRNLGIEYNASEAA